MSDLISRQAAIKAVDELPNCYNGYSDTYDKSCIIGLLEELPSVQPEQRWIPVSERLPDEGQMCLVCDRGAIGIDTYIGHGNPYNWKWYMRDYDAWMPLPEPYQSET